MFSFVFLHYTNNSYLFSFHFCTLYLGKRLRENDVRHTNDDDADDATDDEHQSHKDSLCAEEE